MKLFLASVIVLVLEHAKKLFPEIKNPRLVFIPTASNPYDDRWFVDDDRKKLTQFGFELDEFDIAGKDLDEIKKHFIDADGVYVAGGNVFYLMQEMTRNGFDSYLSTLVKNGFPYMGGSAGAVATSPTIEYARGLDHPEEAPELKDFSGLGWIDFLVLPHADNLKYESRIKTTGDMWRKNGYEVVSLNDDQVLIVDGDSKTIY